MFTTKKEALLNLYLEDGKSEVVLRKIIQDYGEEVLLEMGEAEVNLFIDKILLEKRYNILAGLSTNVGKVKPVYQNILSRFGTGSVDYEFNEAVILFLYDYDFTCGANNHVRKEALRFLSCMLSYRDTSTSTSVDEVEYVYRDDIINAIATNPNLGLEYLLELCSIETSLYEEVLKRLHCEVKFNSFFDLVYAVNEIKSHIELVMENDNPHTKTLRPEVILKDGLHELLTSSWFYNHWFDMLLTLPDTTLYKSQAYKPIYTLIIDTWLSTSLTIIQDVNIKIDALRDVNYEGSSSDINVLTFDIQNRNLDAIWITLFYGEDMMRQYQNFLFYNVYGYKSIMRKIQKVFKQLVKMEILSEEHLSFEGMERFIINLQEINERSQNLNSDFNIEQFLADVSGDDDDDEEEYE